MENGKHKTNSFNSFQFVVKKSKRLTEREAWLTLKMGVSSVSSVSGVSSVSSVSSVPHPYSLPFREGPGVGFSPSPSAKRG